MTTPSFTQVTFRLRNDDGTEGSTIPPGATWRQAQGADDTITVDTNFRCRFRIDETNSRAWTSKTWNLYYQINAGGYLAVTTSTPVKYSLSGNFTQGDDCTSQLTGGTGTFVTDNNGMCESAGATNSGTAGYLFEVEYCVTLDRTQVAHGDTINLRVYDGSTPLVTYSDTPVITVSEPPIIVLDAAALTASGPALTVVATGGPATIALDAAAITAIGQVISVTPISLRANGARDFNGSTDRIDFSSIYDPVGTGFTVAAWVNIDDVPSSYRYMFCAHRSGDTAYGIIFYFGYSDATNYIYYFEVSGTTALIRATNQILETAIVGKWLHCLATWDGSTTAANVHLYINGVEQTYGTTTNGASLNPVVGSWSIGGRIYDDGRNLDGKIGEVATWNRVLSSDEIALLASMSALRSGNNLISGLKFCVHPDEPQDLVTLETGTLDGTTLAYGPDLVFGKNLQLDAATLTATGQVITVDAGAVSPITIPLSVATIEVKAQVGSVSAGAVSIQLDAATVTASGPALTVAKGTVALLMDAATLTASAPVLSVVRGARTIVLTAAALTATGQPITLSKGVVSVLLDAASLVSSGPALTVSLATFIYLDAASIVASGPALNVLKGTVSIVLDAATLNATGGIISVGKGTATIILDVATLAATGQVLIVSRNVRLNAATLTATGQVLTTVKGTVTITLDVATLVASGPIITVTSGGAPPTTIVLDAAALAATGNALVVVKGAIIITLDVASINVEGRSTTILKGAVTIPLDAAALTAGGQVITIVKGTATVVLDASSIVSNGRPITMAMGAVSVTLDVATLTATGQVITLAKGTATVILDAATLTASGPQVTISNVGGATIIYLDVAVLTASGKRFTILGGLKAKVFVRIVRQRYMSRIILWPSAPTAGEVGGGGEGPAALPAGEAISVTAQPEGLVRSLFRRVTEFVSSLFEPYEDEL